MSEYVTIYAGVDQLRIEKQALLNLMWAGVPKAVKEPTSPEARPHRILLLALDAFLYKFGPAQLDSLFPGQQVRMPKGEDRVRWYMLVMLQTIAQLAVSHEWSFDIESGAENEQGGLTYQVRGIAPRPAELEAPASTAGAGEGASAAGDQHDCQTVELAVLAGG